MALERRHSWMTPSSGEWDDAASTSNASTTSDIVLPGGGEAGGIPLPSEKELVINLKNLSKSDPRGKEIKALASEYKKLRKNYRELKKREAEAAKALELSREALRERSYTVEVKELKERKNGKEFKGLKKKSLEKARRKYRDRQARFEEDCINLKKIQVEARESATRLNETGSQLKEAWNKRGRPKEEPRVDHPVIPQSASGSGISTSQTDHNQEDMEAMLREHDEAFELAREEARINRIEQARARFRSAITREDSALAASVERDRISGPFASSPDLRTEMNQAIETKQLPAVPPRDGRGRSKSIFDMQKRLGLLSTVDRTPTDTAGGTALEGSHEGGESSEATTEDERNRKKEEIISRLQKGRAMSLLPLSQQRESERADLGESDEATERPTMRNRAMTYHPASEPLLTKPPVSSSSSSSSSMQRSDGRLTYHQRPMQAGKRRPSRRHLLEERKGDRGLRIGEHEEEYGQRYLSPPKRRESVEMEPVMNEEQMGHEVERMRMDLKEEMRHKREERLRNRKRDIITTPEVESPLSEEAEVSARSGRAKRAKGRNEKAGVREDDLREEKAMALRELQQLIEENDKLLREMEEKDLDRERERKAEKEVENFLARKLDGMRKEILQQKETIDTLQAGLSQMRESADAEAMESKHADEQRSKELTTMRKTQKAMERELADTQTRLESTASELAAARQQLEEREKEWKKAMEEEREETGKQLRSHVQELQAEREAVHESEQRAKEESQRELERLRSALEESKRELEEMATRVHAKSVRERELTEEQERLQAAVDRMNSERQANLEERQQLEAERARVDQEFQREKEEMRERDKEMSHLREELEREQQKAGKLQEELSEVKRKRDAEEEQLDTIGGKLQQAKQRKHGLKAELSEEKKVREELHQSLESVQREDEQLKREKQALTENLSLTEEELERERKARALLEERVKQLEEGKMVSDEVVKRVGQRMEKQKRDSEELLGREREEKQKLSEAVEFERGRAAQLEREREERAELEAQRQKERLDRGEQQSEEEARLREELDNERQSRETLLKERNKELAELNQVKQEMNKLIEEMKEAHRALESEREGRDQLQQEKQSLVALIEIERRRMMARTSSEEKQMEQLSHEMDSLRQELDKQQQEKLQLAERVKKEKESLQRELRARQEEVVLKKEKTKLLRAKILDLMEENRRIKEDALKEKEKEQEAESRRIKSERERLRMEHEREERERAKKAAQEKDRIMKEQEERDQLHKMKEKELDDLRRNLQEKEFIEKAIYCANINAYVGGDVPRAVVDLYTFLCEYQGDAAQKGRFIRKALDAITTSAQRIPGDIEVQAFWLSYTASLSLMIFGKGEVEPKAGLKGRDAVKDLRNWVVTRSIKDRGIAARFWLDKEKRNMSRQETRHALQEAIGREERSTANVPFTLLHLEVIMIDLMTNILELVKNNLSPLLVPAIVQFRPFLSRRDSMVRRERERDRKRRPSAASALDSESGRSVSPDEVIATLADFLKRLQTKKLYPIVIQVLFEDVIHFIDAHLFNALILKSELCTSAIGFQIKFGLSPIKEWLFAAHLNDPARLRDCLGHIEEAANVLVVDKRLFRNEKEVKEIFQILNPVQILHFLSAFRTEEPTEAVPQESLQAVRQSVARLGEKKFSLKLDPEANPLPPPSHQ